MSSITIPAAFTVISFVEMDVRGQPQTTRCHVPTRRSFDERASPSATPTVLSSEKITLKMTSNADGDDLKKAARLFNKILNQPKLSSSTSRTDKHVDEGIKKIRRLILVDGIPHAIVSAQAISKKSAAVEQSQDPNLRPRIWKILLGVNDLSADKFLRYVGRGPCEFKEKIRNDTFRCQC